MIYGERSLEPIFGEVAPGAVDAGVVHQQIDLRKLGAEPRAELTHFPKGG
jgi:hypothetical protein